MPTSKLVITSNKELEVMKSIEIMLNMPKSNEQRFDERSNNCFNRMDAIGRTTEWHEGHQKFEVWRKNNTNDKQIA